MKYTYYKNRFSSNANGVEHIDGAWDDIKKIVLERKYWRSFNATSVEQYKRCKEQFDAIVMAEMKPNMPRTADNVVSFAAIVLDIDNGASYQQVRDDLNSYEYLLFSSGGTGLKSGDRFRVILPLNHEMPADDWKKYNTSLAERFPYSDECFKKGVQIQYLPVLNNVFQDQFIAEHHEGQCFDYKNPNDLPFVETQSLESITKNIEFSTIEFTDEEFKELANAIIEHQAFSLGYEERRLLAQRLKCIGMPDFDIVQVLDRVSQVGFSTPNNTLVNGANPQYAHPQGLYKHIPKGMHIPALERRIVRSGTFGEGHIEDKYDGEWTLGDGEYLSDIIDEINFSTGNNLLIADVNTGKTRNFTNKNGEPVYCKIEGELFPVKFVAPLVSIVRSIGESNSLTNGDVGTWDQIKGIINTRDKSAFKNTVLVVDEVHGFYADYSYRGSTINKLIECFKFFKAVIMMSGTVEADHFSTIKFNKVFRVHKASKAIKNIRTLLCTKKNDLVIEHINNLTNKTIVLANDKNLCNVIQNKINRKSLIVNADVKDTQDVVNFFSSGLMNNYEVIIGTNSIVEGLSIEDELLDVDIVIVGDLSPERIEQFSNRFRNVSGTKNVWYFVDRKPVEVLDDYNRDNVLIESRRLCDGLQSVYEAINDSTVRMSFTRQFKSDMNKDLIYFNNGEFDVSFTGVDYDYSCFREKQYRNDFYLLSKKLISFGFNVLYPIVIDGDDKRNSDIKEEKMVIKEARYNERADELNKLIDDINRNNVKGVENSSSFYCATYDSVQKLLVKGLVKDDISKLITGYIDDESFFAKAHSDADFISTGQSIREMIINSIGCKDYVTSSEIMTIANNVIEKVLMAYFNGDVDMMMESRSWGSLVCSVPSGNTYGIDIYNKSILHVLPLQAKSGKSAKEILNKFIQLGDSKIKSILGVKTRISPIVQLSLTGLHFEPTGLKYINPVLEKLKLDIEAAGKKQSKPLMHVSTDSRDKREKIMEFISK